MERKTLVKYIGISLFIILNITLSFFTYRNYRNLQTTVQVINQQGIILQNVVQFLNQALEANKPK